MWRMSRLRHCREDDVLCAVYEPLMETQWAVNFCFSGLGYKMLLKEAVVPNSPWRISTGSKFVLKSWRTEYVSLILLLLQICHVLDRLFNTKNVIYFVFLKAECVLLFIGYCLFCVFPHMNIYFYCAWLCISSA